MPKKITAIILAVCLALSALATQAAAQPALKDYQNYPYWIATRSVPMVLLVLSKDQKMFRHAYSPGDHDGDGKLDIGFNPEIRYLGYHDSSSCYRYDDTKKYFTRTRYAKDPGKESARPAGLAAHIKIPKNAYGVCDAKGEWHGNWLNFVMTSRIDAIKKVLYGGTRSSDDEKITVLEHSYIPRNALVWGYDIMADNEWSGRTGHLPYYNADYYTGIGKPTQNNMHFFARYTNAYSRENLTEKPPLLDLIPNIPASAKNKDGTNFRVWNWTVLGAESLIPATIEAFTYAGLTPYTYTKDEKTYNARVQVCNMINGVDNPQNGPPEGESCAKYPNGQYKPTGLLQKYGEKNTMYFGLMTGTADGITKQKGGVVRHHIDSISKAVNPENGILTENRKDLNGSNIIRTIDKLTVTSWLARGLDNSFQPRGAFQNNAGSNGNDGADTEWSAFGNPMGEMLYEGVRYFGALAGHQSLLEATAVFQPTGESNAHIYPQSTRPLPAVSSKDALLWMSKRPTDLDDACSKPVILMLSDLDNTFDGDDLASISGPPLLPSLAKDADIPANFDNKGYLDKITDHEGYRNGKRYYYAKNPGNIDEKRDICQPREITGAQSLADVTGLCPNEPSLKGSYSMAAVAHYAHTHKFSSGETAEPIDTYAVAVTPALPALEFAIPEGGGEPERRITIMPTGIMGANKNVLLSFIGYAIENWDIDDNGIPYKVRINLNYPNESEVAIGWSDYEQDSTSIYEINLLTDSTTPAIGTNACVDVCREAEEAVIHSGPFRGYNPPTKREGGRTVADAAGNPTANGKAEKYYRFVRKPGSQAMKIPRDRIKGLSITSMILLTSSANDIGLGYTITGTDDDYDGTYVDVSSNGQNDRYTPSHAQGIKGWEVNGVPAMGIHSNNNTPHPWVRGVNVNNDDPLFTPMGCDKPGVGTNPVANGYCGTNNKTAGAMMRILQTRSFRFAAKAPDDVEYLPTPMELAAKYGGFSDTDGDGLPGGPANWAAVEGHNAAGAAIYGQRPKNYFYVANLSSLSQELGNAFEAIANSVSTGTANSASINEVLGGGMTVKTQYHSNYPKNSPSAVKWLGNVYSLFIDAWGNQREDTQKPGDPNQERQLNTKEDWILSFESNRGGSPDIWRYQDRTGANSMPTPPYQPPSWVQLDSAEEIQDVWNVTRWLMKQTNVITPRGLSNTGGRRIYSYFPKAVGDSLQQADGSGDWTAVELNDDYVFEQGKAANEQLQRLLRANTDTHAKQLINYTLGQDQTETGFRPRKVEVAEWAWDLGPGQKEWRLGDVMNSSPIIISEAASNFHMLYKGVNSYAQFKAAVSGRRNMVYFGSNDGILHAVNGGFYGSVKSGYAAYSVTPITGAPADPKNINRIAKHDLGAEIWGYIPTSLLPHLSWPTEMDFNHVYMLDLTPTIVDVKIGKPGEICSIAGQRTAGSNGADPCQGWRTVLFGGLRLGGRTIDINPLNNDTDQNNNTAPEYVHSEYFAMDITDPEAEPRLLWRYSSAELGQSVSRPMAVRSVDDQGDDAWYVVLPSGPTVNIFDANGRVTNEEDGPDTYKGQSEQKARVIVLNAATGKRVDKGQLVVAEEKSFFNNTFMPVAQKVDPLADDGKWNNHVVYLGLSAKGKTIKDSATGADRVTDYESGALYRLRMVNAATGNAVSPDQWELVRMIDTQRPVTGAVNAAYDTLGQLWVVFGTGRIWDRDDAWPCGPNSPLNDTNCKNANTQYFYGLKEAMDGNGLLSFARDSHTNENLEDVSDYAVYSDGSVCKPTPGNECKAANTAGYGSYANFALGLKTNANTKGYRRALKLRENLDMNDPATFVLPNQENVFEMIDTQPQIDGRANGVSNTVVTVYIPSGESCRPEGGSYLLIMDTFTGLPASYMVAYDNLMLGGDSYLNAAGESVGRQTGAILAGGGKATAAHIASYGDTTFYGTYGGNDGGAHDTTLPPDPGSGGSKIISWREVFDTAAPMEPEDYYSDLLSEPAPQTP